RVSFMGGMSSAARANVIFKDAGTLEGLANVNSPAFDKSGTLTRGAPTVARIEPVDGPALDTFHLAASADQCSVHVSAVRIISYARSQQLDLVAVTEAEEVATHGVAATTGAGDELRVGKSAFIAEVVPEFSELELHAGETAVYVSRAHQLIGIIILADPLRATS